MPVNALFSFLMKKRLQQIELFRDHPHEAQLEVYRLRESGRHRMGPGMITTSPIRCVPPTCHSGLCGCEALGGPCPGGANLLATDIRWFAKSSGTTNAKSKYIPVSREALEECHYKGGKDLVALHFAMQPQSRLYQGMTMVVGGSSAVEPLRTDAYTGDLSAIIIRNLPLWVEVRRTPVIETALMEDWEAKVERMARETMREDVRSIAGVPSWTLVVLKRVLELTGKKNILEVWPNLELFMHGGVSFRPYREQYKKLFPSPAVN